MKHPVRQTVELIVWLVASLGLSMVLMPLVSSQKTVEVNPLLAIGIVIGMVLLGALMWLYIINRWTPERARLFFSIGMAFLWVRASNIILPQVDIILRICFNILVGLLIFIIFDAVSRWMEKSWAATRHWYWVLNIVMIVALSTAAVLFGTMLPPWSTLIILGLIGVYDYVAVYKTRHMIKFAEFFMKHRILPGIVVPYKQKDRFALLGGGDIFFIAFVGASFFKQNVSAVFWTMGGMLAALLILFIIGRKKKYYPAIPFIFAGCIAGLLMFWITI